jgi:CheY-like chemotaxis protein
MEMTRALVPNSKLELIYKVDEKVPPFIIGDSSRIKQVILNLLSNAVKYTERGQVELRISYMRGKENLLILQVHDTGPGISPEDQTRIFEPFERTNAARKRPGTGLGLTISKKLVEAMKGTISLTSTLGQGACFTIELPAPPASAFEAKIDATKPPVDFSKILRILVAEDVAPSRVLLTVMLTNLGHNVTAVENGLEALQIASEMPFDLILMDLQMPEMDGVTATQRIRASKGPNRHTRILAVSANADVDGPNGLAAAGFDDALLKPIKPERLRFLLNEIVAQI